VGKETAFDYNSAVFILYSFYSSTVSSVDVSMTVSFFCRIGLFLLLVSNFSTGCYLNDCICWNSEIICENEDGPEPLFTDSERFVANILYISANQKAWISRTCGLFPRMIKVIMLD
jgi:hypothetical protein